MPRLHTVICSTRPTRIGPAVARWIHGAAQDHGGFDAHLVDLADFALPVFDEPEHPRLGRYQHEHTRRWAASVAAADAFVFVTPEYNYGPPSALLNAMTFLSREWHYKPAAFASYGGVSGGLRGTQVLKQLLPGFRMMPIPDAVVVPNVASQIDAEGRFVANDLHRTSARAMLGELLRWTGAMGTLRAA